MRTQSPLWYLRGKGNQPAGPFTAEQVLQGWQAGRLRADAICWREGMPQWLPLSQIEPFASAIGQANTSGQVAKKLTTSHPLPTTQAGPSAPPAHPAGQSGTTLRMPIALRLLPFVLFFIVLTVAGAAYLLTQEHRKTENPPTSPREMGEHLPYPEPNRRNGREETERTTQKATRDLAGSMRLRRTRTKSSTKTSGWNATAIGTWLNQGGRFSSTTYWRKKK